MKKILLLFALPLFFNACTKDDDAEPTPNPVDLLPPATQTGAMTFGCLINGEPYICKGDEVVAYYQSYQWKDHFDVSGFKETESYPIWKVSLTNHDDSPIEENTTYTLSTNYIGWINIIGGPDNYLESARTNNQHKGEMTITRFDVYEAVVSGTFWFDVENPWTGEKIEVREGRFDTYFLQ